MASGGSVPRTSDEQQPTTTKQSHKDDIKGFLKIDDIDKDDATNKSTETSTYTSLGDMLPPRESDEVMVASKDDEHCHIVSSNKLPANVINEDTPTNQEQNSEIDQSQVLVGGKLRSATPSSTGQNESIRHRSATYPCTSRNKSKQCRMSLDTSKEVVKLIDFKMDISPLQEKVIITPQSLFEEHVLRGDAVVNMNSCAALASSIGECNWLKDLMIDKFISSSIKTRGKIPTSPLLKQFMSDSDILGHCELIVLGQDNSFSWFLPNSEINEIATCCLLSHLVNICKKRGDNCYDKLEFNLGDTEAAFSTPEIQSQIQKIHEEVKSNWQADECLQKIIPAGLSLINILNIGSSKAAQAFLPYLNKYCKRSIHLVWCNDKDTLKRELTEPAIEQSMSTQLIKRLKGCLNEEQCVLLTEIANSESDKQEDNELKKDIREKTGVEKIKHLQFPVQEGTKVVEEDARLKQTKETLEQVVVKAPFHTVAYLREILLLLMIRKKNRFWMKRSEVEHLSTQLHFMNGNLDRFLRIFTSIGSIFHTHDIPALDDYVITDIVAFIKRVHQLYEEQNKLAKYGLFSYKEEEDIQTIFKFLTTLGIAVKVKSTQIHDCLAIAEDQTYCYIPSARSQQLPATDIHDIHEHEKMRRDSVVISFNRCIAENLQACFCNELLIMGGRLVPTENCDTTVMTICNTARVQITDYGKDVEIAMLQDPSKPHKSIEVLSKVLLNYPCIKTKAGSKLRYQVLKVSDSLGQTNNQFIRAIQETDHSCPHLKNMTLSELSIIAHQLADQYSDSTHELIVQMMTHLRTTLPEEEFERTVRQLFK